MCCSTCIEIVLGLKFGLKFDSIDNFGWHRQSIVLNNVLTGLNNVLNNVLIIFVLFDFHTKIKSVVNSVTTSAIEKISTADNFPIALIMTELSKYIYANFFIFLWN